MSTTKKWVTIGLFFLLLVIAGTQAILIKYTNIFVAALMLACFAMVIFLNTWKDVERDDSDVG